MIHLCAGAAADALRRLQLPASLCLSASAPNCRHTQAGVPHLPCSSLGRRFDKLTTSLKRRRTLKRPPLN